jgi:hypothetical protein
MGQRQSVYDLPGESAMDAEVIAAYDVPGAQNHIEIEAPAEVEDGEQWEKERQEAHAAERTKTYPDVYVNGEDVTVTVDPYGKRGRHATFEMRDDTMFWRHKAAEHRGALKDHRVVMNTLASLDKEECLVRTESTTPWFEGSLTEYKTRADRTPATMDRWAQYWTPGQCVVGRHNTPPETFIPTSAMIDKMDKLTPRCVASSTWGYAKMGSTAGAGILYAGERGNEIKVDRWGKLPEISARMYKGTLNGYACAHGACIDTDLHLENAPLTFDRARDRTFDCGGEWGVCR